MSKKSVLVIMDGFGLAPDGDGNAIYQAKTPNLDALFQKYPKSKLSASGLDVGLPDGQMGNSEVGHTNIGAGRVVFQDLPKISKEIEDGDFFKNEAYVTALKAAKENGKSVHVMGLLSSGGVHSHINHIFAMLDMAKQFEIEHVYVHCFMDGRDVAPDSGLGFVKQMHEKCQQVGNAKIATISGRFYAMDRDKRWDRLETAYNAIVCGEGVKESDPVKAMQDSYDKGVTDEFVVPVVVCEDGMIQQGDSVIFMNFRPDRAREITWALNNTDFDGFDRKKTVFPLNYVCTAQYDEALDIPIAYPPETLVNTLGDVVSAKGFKQFRVAETEKYAHVTFFFNGGVERPVEGEDRCLVDSPKEFPTYDLIPQMSAVKVCDKLVEAIESDQYEMIICNFANCDMVGHTGVLEAAIKAVETVDACIGRVVEAVEKKSDEMTLFVKADHGNADCMINADGSVNTAHTTNLVPFVATDVNAKLADGKLADIAPTMLKVMEIEQPEEMTGNVLISW